MKYIDHHYLYSSRDPQFGNRCPSCMSLTYSNSNIMKYNSIHYPGIRRSQGWKFWGHCPTGWRWDETSAGPPAGRSEDPADEWHEAKELLAACFGVPIVEQAMDLPTFWPPTVEPCQLSKSDIAAAVELCCPRRNALPYWLLSRKLNSLATIWDTYTLDYYVT